MAISKTPTRIRHVRHQMAVLVGKGGTDSVAPAAGARAAGVGVSRVGAAGFGAAGVGVSRVGAAGVGASGR